jgi:hypothetical protein
MDTAGCRPGAAMRVLEGPGYVPSNAVSGTLINYEGRTLAHWAIALRVKPGTGVSLVRKGHPSSLSETAAPKGTLFHAYPVGAQGQEAQPGLRDRYRMRASALLSSGVGQMRSRASGLSAASCGHRRRESASWASTG